MEKENTLEAFLDGEKLGSINMSDVYCCVANNIPLNQWMQLHGMSYYDSENVYEYKFNGESFNPIEVYKKYLEIIDEENWGLPIRINNVEVLDSNSDLHFKTRCSINLVDLSMRVLAYKGNINHFKLNNTSFFVEAMEFLVDSIDEPYRVNSYYTENEYRIRIDWVGSN